MIWWILLVLVVGVLVYVRVAPSDVARWHKPVTQVENKTFAGAAVRVLPADEGMLARVDAAVRALPRTQVLAGSVEEGRVTYITRSAAIGFPDYTTVEQTDGQLRMYARLRFGKSDFGVNAKRLEGLLAAAKAGG